MTEPTRPETSCSGGCGLKTADPEAVGWECLPITGRYRCGVCTRMLQAASALAPLRDDPPPP